MYPQCTRLEDSLSLMVLMVILQETETAIPHLFDYLMRTAWINGLLEHGASAPIRCRVSVRIRIDGDFENHQKMRVFKDLLCEIDGRTACKASASVRSRSDFRQASNTSHTFFSFLCCFKLFYGHLCGTGQEALSKVIVGTFKKHKNILWRSIKIYKSHVASS